ncbi:cell division protein FtsZ [Enterobacter sp. DE0047]|uniref:cell division protein FtsZ n=1 Tax=Enterobacter sp. DE0047 TaxID=2584949 RepID=UPI0011A28A3C|nr:cell division protein FtsZ [Enterobacter sp. DE0047]
MLNHYGTQMVPRSEVLPGTRIKHDGRTMRSSANIEKGLYAFTLHEKTLIKSELVEVFLNNRGLPDKS